MDAGANTHHDMSVQPDGRIVVLSQHHVDAVSACQDLAKGPYLADELLTVTADGREVDSFSLAEAFCRSEFLNDGRQFFVKASYLFRF